MLQQTNTKTRFLNDLFWSNLILILIFIFNPTDTAAEETTNSKLKTFWMGVIQNPSDPQINIQYGVEAEKSGYYGRAIAAYRRALNTDPKNDTAIQKLNHLLNLNKPNELSGTLIVSSSYRSNASQARTAAKSDKTISNTFVLSDDRSLFGNRWKTTLINFADAHSDLRDSDIIYTSINSGPYVEHPDGKKSTFGFNIENTVIDQKTDSYSLGVSGSFSLVKKFQSNLDYTVKYIKGYSEGSISYFNSSVSTAFNINKGILKSGDSFDLNPSVSLNINKKGFNSSGSRDRLTNISSTFNYTFPLTRHQSFDVFYNPTFIHYFKHRKSDPQNRMDLTQEVGLSYNINLFDNVTFTATYVCERNLSNFSEFNYLDHLISTSLITTF